MLWTDMYTSNNMFNNNDSSSLPSLQNYQSFFKQNEHSVQIQPSARGSIGSSAQVKEVRYGKPQQKTNLKRKSSPDNDESSEEKRKNFLERNRQAALKCRQRKKQWLNNLQERIEFLTDDNEQLQLQANIMRDEVRSLQNLLLIHKDCPMNNGNNTAALFLSQSSIPTSSANDLYNRTRKNNLNLH